MNKGKNKSLERRPPSFPSLSTQASIVQRGFLRIDILPLAFISIPAKADQVASCSTTYAGTHDTPRRICTIPSSRHALLRSGDSGTASVLALLVS